MQYTLLPVFLFVACTLGLATFLLVLSKLFNPGRPNRVTQMPYESGMDPIHDTRRRFDVRFHLLAIAFLVFDVELLFLYPLAVAMSQGREEVASGKWQVASGEYGKSLSTIHYPLSTPSPVPRPQSPAPTEGIDYAVERGWVQSRDLAFGGAAVFLLLLVLGYVYDWRKGVFQWR